MCAAALLYVLLLDRGPTLLAGAKKIIPCKLLNFRTSVLYCMCILCSYIQYRFYSANKTDVKIHIYIYIYIYISAIRLSHRMFSLPRVLCTYLLALCGTYRITKNLCFCSFYFQVKLCLLTLSTLVCFKSYVILITTLF